MTAPVHRCLVPFCRQVIPAVPGEVRPPRVCPDCAARAVMALRVGKDVGLRVAGRALGRALEREYPDAYGVARDAYQGWKRAELDRKTLEPAPAGPVRATVVDFTRRKGAA